MTTARLIITIGIILLLTSCGKKGPVRPLEANLPASVKNVELRQQGDKLLLSWQLPTHNQNNTLLESSPVIDIYRILFDPANDCPDCTDRSTLLHSIDPELPQPALQNGDRYLLQDRQVAANQGYRYRLVPRNKDGQAGQPLVMRIIFAEPLAAPAELRVEAHDRSATLNWQPFQPVEGQELLGYRIYRHHKGASSELLNPRPLTEPIYEDFNLENGTTYSYQVRALLKQGEKILESLPSVTITATPQAGL
jgi:hypothetical protein